jgi:stearoyl-CoA desaturase (delta-9 desaturase)
MAFFDSVINLLAHGVLDAAWWQVTLYTLVVTHLTIVSVTVYLHRHQAHRALELHAIPSHFFRFWLWLTTGMETKEFVAVHRKHHAKCETEEDPHSPQTRGIDTLLLRGTELYRAEARNKETLSRYGQGTPTDWLERNVYTLNSRKGVVLMILINLFLFGGIGATVWAIQMAWIPVMATGIINGIGHYWGYRNFETVDASRNVSPWGILIGGEELHNNHHTYATSARFSVKPYEFDVGWFYISVLEAMGLAKAKKTPPKMQLGDVRAVADEKTLEALIAHRYEVMAGYARSVRETCKTEIAVLKTKGEVASSRMAALKSAKRWLPRDADKVPASAVNQLALARADHPVLDKMVVMREELRQLWLNTSVSREQLTKDLQGWCRRAEESGIAALQDFSLRLRAARV